MKKAIFTLAVLMMAFGNVGFAQNRAIHQKMDKQLMSYFGIRHNGDLRPYQAVVANTNGDKSRFTYIYDEDEFYLYEELMENYDGTNWQKAEKVTYEYGFDLEVLEELGQSWDGSDWENSFYISYSYEDALVKEVVYQTWDGSDWVNETKKVYDYHGDALTILYWKWNGSTWSSDELYTYTFNDSSIELVIQYMQGGAWQNLSRYVYDLDFDGNILEITIEGWINNSMWDYMENLVYDYQDGVYVSMSVYFGPYGDPQYRMEYVYEDGNAVLGESMYRMANGQYAPYDGQIEMAFGFNLDQIVYDGCIVEMTYLDVTGLNEDSQAGFNVYPNPVSDRLTIDIANFQKAELYSLTGQKVMESEKGTFEVDNLQAGVYMLKVYDLNGNSESQRIVVK